MQAFIRRASGLAAAFVLLAGCGTDTQTSAVATSTARGTLVESPPLRIASLSATALADELTASGTSGQQLLLIAGTPACGVDFHYFHYQTVDPAGTAIRDSGALMIPTGGTGCTGPRPIVLYAHGTDTDKALNIADITDPTNSEGALIATMFAAQGYIVVAPNYAGYDDSTLSYHPYLNADQQSKDMIDALAAARSALGKVIASGTTDNGKLFITGYSQGGHVAMATHRALQAISPTAVTASAPMSGPYALEAFGDYIMTGHVDLGSTVFTPMLTTSFQKSYGDIYTTVGDVYESAYATGIEGILPSTTSLTDLFMTGKLPQLQLFHDTDWTGATPTGVPQLDATLDVVLQPSTDPLFGLGFGPNNLVKDSYRVGYVADVLQNPDGALLQQPNFMQAATPTNTLRVAFKTNDLRNWTPTAPVFLCGGALDPTVFFPINTSVMQAYWTYVAPVAAPQLLTVLDLESAITGPADPFALAKGGFAQAKAATFTAAGGGLAGQSAVVQAYHGGLVPPFCTAAVRGFFSQF